MKTHEPITLRRDCEAIVIPDGYRVTLPAGSDVIVTQSLGGDYTVRTSQGYLARISGKDVDAIGGDPGSPAKDEHEQEYPGERRRTSTSTDVEVAAAEGPFDETLVWNELATCYDPEIPVNIVDLGLVYDCQVKPLAVGGHRVEIKMTLTAPGCGMGEVLKADVERKVLRVPGVQEVDVELVWEPNWNPSLMSEAAKLELNMLW
jgi:probable FeS assembly SUF system protein SufT